MVQDFSHQQHHRGPWCSSTFILFEKDVLPSHFPWKVWVILCLLKATSSDNVVNDLACAYVPMEADHTLMGNLIQWIWYHHMKQLVVWIKAVRRCKVVARPHCETMIPSDDTMKSLQSWRQNILKTAKTMQVEFSLYSLQSGPSSYSVNVEERVKESFFWWQLHPLIRNPLTCHRWIAVVQPFKIPWSQRSWRWLAVPWATKFELRIFFGTWKSMSKHTRVCMEVSN